MKARSIIQALAGITFFAVAIFSAISQPSNVVTGPAVYVPDTSHAHDLLPDGIIAWDSNQKTVEATNGQESAGFVFTLTNVSSSTVAILEGHGSCSCTTVQLPTTAPWLMAPGDTGEIAAKIDLAGKMGTIFKYAIITTDKGTKNLMLRVNILPPVNATISEGERMAGVAAAKLDRQAVFKNDCAGCHAKNVEGKYGKDLYDQVCSICHEATPRATMVPDLHHLKDSTSPEFWRMWITVGKPGTLMPAFAKSQGGPLDDQQISSLATYLNGIMPPHSAEAGWK